MKFLGLTLFFWSISLAQAQQVYWPQGSSGEISETECLNSYPNPSFLKLNVNPEDVNSEIFNFFYFSSKPFDSNKPSFLYVDGGPGQISGSYVNTLRFDEMSSHNVIYFHPRGSGCSSLPLDNTYDQYIRIKNVQSDLEVLRKHLGIKSWDIVYSVSYGTFFSLKYQEAYPGVINHLFLEALFDPSFVQSDSDRVGNFLDKGIPTFLEILKTWPEFNNLKFEYLSHIETQMQNLMSLGDLKDINDKTIDFSVFFEALFPIAYHGSGDDHPMRRALAISSVMAGLELFIGKENTDLLNIKLKVDIFNKLPMQSLRVNLLIRTYEGLSPEFISELEKQKSVKSALFAAYGFNYGRLIYPLEDVAKKISDLNLKFDPQIKIYQFQGEMDAITPLESAVAFKQKNPQLKSSIQVNKKGHANHFSEACYAELLPRMMASETLDTNIFTDINSKCFLKFGFKLF